MNRSSPSIDRHPSSVIFTLSTINRQPSTVIFLLTSCLLFLISYFLFHISASPAQAAEALTLAPALVRTTIDDQNTPVEATYHLKNTTSQAIDLTTTIYPITEHDLLGRPVLTDIDFSSPPPSPSSISLNPTSTTLFPGETVSFVATLHPQFLSPGSSHFMIVFKQTTDPTTATHTIIPVISGLLHVRNPFGEDRRLTISDTNLPRLTTAIPTQVELNVTNPGNSDITPYGDVLTQSLNGQTLRLGYLNQNSRVVYPGQSMSIEAIMVKPPQPFLIDQLNYQFQGHDETNSVFFNHRQSVIYISPLALLLFSLTVLATGIILANRKYHFIRLNLPSSKK